MIIREITVGELAAFTESELYASISPKPLTVLRAVSQSHNPRANPGDIALVIAYEGNTLLAIAGLLPDWVSGNPGLQASSNSGWWAHPLKGRAYALPVLARAIKGCRYRMFLTDCTPHSKEILEKTGWFEFPEPVAGVKTVFRFYLGQMAERRFGKSFVSKTARWADAILNALLLPLIPSGKTVNNGHPLSVKVCQDLDERLTGFIEDHNREEFTRRSAGEIRWILGRKWLQTGKPVNPVEYPFSVYARNFSQPVVVFSRDEALIAAAILTIRDHHASVPYLWCEKGEEERVWKTIVSRLAGMKIVSLTSYSPEYIRLANTRHIPFLVKKQINRHIAFTKELLPLFRKSPVLQDGDGDCAFT